MCHSSSSEGLLPDLAGDKSSSCCAAYKRSDRPYCGYGRTTAVPRDEFAGKVHRGTIENQDAAIETTEGVLSDPRYEG
jgi:hypothetical protein